MQKPDIKVVDDKIMVVQPIVGVDLDGDGIKSVQIGLVAEVDKIEGAQEIMTKVLQANLPDWLKKALGVG